MKFSGLVLPFNVRSKNGTTYKSIDGVAKNLLVTYLSSNTTPETQLSDVCGVVDSYDIKDDGLYITGRLLNTPLGRSAYNFSRSANLQFVPRGIGIVNDGIVTTYDLTSINILHESQASFDTNVIIEELI